MKTMLLSKDIKNSGPRSKTPVKAQLKLLTKNRSNSCLKNTKIPQKISPKIIGSQGPYTRNNSTKKMTVKSYMNNRRMQSPNHLKEELRPNFLQTTDNVLASITNFVSRRSASQNKRRADLKPGVFSEKHRAIGSGRRKCTQSPANDWKKEMKQIPLSPKDSQIIVTQIEFSEFSTDSTSQFDHNLKAKLYTQIDKLLPWQHYMHNLS